MRILIVEDDGILAASLGMMLEGSGHEVVGHAATVKTAMDLARRHRPTLTLVDIDLGPGGSGIAAARGMRKHLGLTCLFVTDQVERARGAADAALGMLAKPYTRDMVVAGVGAVEALMKNKPPGDLPDGLQLFTDGSITAAVLDRKPAALGLEG
ncbi:regulator [Skermanella stibiiresistens SB22]|uniref:Regulator n=1 Tax=Skermanella stibiiresistens SB22 TaxID=1385369 RepID=W9GWI7_9PROT|nr:response regulator [Skermanella stibiiresistens]EWY36812.1 regulator [Skermanella stibiiresistens SB22]